MSSQATTIDDWLDHDGPDDSTEPDQPDVEAQRQAALEGGARYSKPTGRVTTEDPATSPETTCQCGAHVSDAFARVFAGDDGRVHACPECADGAAIMRGAAAGLDTSRGGRL